MRTLLLTLIICAFTLPVHAKYSGGTGEPNDPYQIATAEDLILLGETPEDYDKHFILTADIDLDPTLPGRKVFDKAVIAPDTEPWDMNLSGGPIFTGVSFKGVVDGNGHVVKNLKITGVSYLGLFGYLSSTASVSNLGLEAIEVNAAWYVGGLVGYNYASITNSYTSGSVTGGRDVGGLVGFNRFGSIIASYSSGSVTGGQYVGGLVGYNSGSIATSYNTGSVSGWMDVGGLVGYNSFGSIANSYSTGLVSGASSVGGFMGRDYQGNVTACFWDIQTSGQTTSASGTGKTTAEMQDPNTFIAAEWGFLGQRDGPHEIWAEPDGGGYPILWWQLSSLPPLPAFSGGDGKAEDAYVISTVEELNSIGHNPRLMECHFKLVADLDLTGVHFYPIGSWYFPYRGVFDGNSHTVLLCIEHDIRRRRMARL